MAGETVRSPRGRKPSRRPVRIPSPVTRRLIDAAAGKEGAVGECAGLGNGYISQLRYGNIVDPGLSAIERLADALGYRLALVPVSSDSSDDNG